MISPLVIKQNNTDHTLFIYYHFLVDYFGDPCMPNNHY